MALEIKTGGAWKAIDTASIKVAGAWKTPDSVAIKVGGVWKVVWPTGPTVSPSTTTPLYRFRATGTCYSGLRFHSDGGEDSLTAAGVWTDNARGPWLDSGLNSEVWVQRVINSGSFTVDAGSGRLVLSTIRAFYVTRSVNGSKICNATFNFYDAASGGSLIGTTGAIEIEAEQGTA